MALCVGNGSIFNDLWGNAFAAFTVITAGIGVPFVFSLGADPIMAGALAMTAGCCGTFINPNGCQFQYSTCSPFGYERSKWRYQSASRSSYCHDYHPCIFDVLFGILAKEIK